MDILHDTMHNSPSLLQVKWKRSKDSCSICQKRMHRSICASSLCYWFPPSKSYPLQQDEARRLQTVRLSLEKVKNRRETEAQYLSLLFTSYQAGWIELIPSVQTHLQSLEPREHHFSSFPS